jgi:hypothetical protein
VRVVSLGVHVTEAVVGLDDAAQFPVARVMEAGVGGEDEKLSRLFPPANVVLADDGLGRDSPMFKNYS